MRPIEFRAFSMEHNMYMFGFGVLPVKYTEKEFGYENEIILFTEFNGEIRCIPETVEQFTGLTDKNGKKIFEGDIVEIIEIDAFGNLDWNRLKGKVMFSEGAYMMAEVNKCYICGKDIPEEDDLCFGCNEERYHNDMFEQEEEA
ncbi:hypothetical protein IA525_06945 [Listeria seeligeri]|uniref:YopX family protein n=1 Tax=Listeria seeligeri TaxID=1640 RepID=UPI0018897499|nr:YopX family protein [Listeria seeligeri]MBF2390474.1 hypothetical protein [Listeria seeligeri]